MRDFKLPEVLARIKQQKSITEEDVLTIRSSVFADAIVSFEEAEMLFDLNDHNDQHDVAWANFFIEAMTDFCVHQAEPAGYVSEENAQWLISKISRDDHVQSHTELELLVKVLEKASSSPESIVKYALEQVKLGVLEGQGPTRQGLSLTPGIIAEAEVDLLRRILYAFGGDRHLAISRAEAEVLFDINDKTNPDENHVSWSDLFVKAVANYMMAASGYQPPTREVALKREAWLEERDGVSGFMSKMVSGGLKSIFDAYSGESVGDKYVKEMQADINISERVTDIETEWLVARIKHDGSTNENERALIEFIKENSPSIHPSFKQLSDYAA